MLLVNAHIEFESDPADIDERAIQESSGLSAPGDCTTAVCVQYDTHLRLENISGDLQTRLGVKAEEDVVFARLEHGAYRDGVRFTNGKEVSLQLLGSGVGATLTAIVKAPAPAIVEVRSDILEHVD